MGHTDVQSLLSILKDVLILPFPSPLASLITTRIRVILMFFLSMLYRLLKNSMDLNSMDKMLVLEGLV